MQYLLWPIIVSKCINEHLQASLKSPELFSCWIADMSKSEALNIYTCKLNPLKPLWLLGWFISWVFLRISPQDKFMLQNTAGVAVCCCKITAFNRCSPFYYANFSPCFIKYRQFGDTTFFMTESKGISKLFSWHRKIWRPTVTIFRHRSNRR